MNQSALVHGTGVKVHSCCCRYADSVGGIVGVFGYVDIERQMQEIQAKRKKLNETASEQEKVGQVIVRSRM